MNLSEISPLVFALLYLTATLVFFFLACGLGYVRVWRSNDPRWAARRLQKRDPSPWDIKREMTWSLVSQLIFTLVATAVWAGIQAGYGQVYFDIGSHGWLWLLFSIVLLVLMHDTLFYWTHWLMHNFGPMKRLHRLHHMSLTPTPWGLYSFSWGEALIQSAILPLSCMVFPVHPLAILVFMAIEKLYSFNGHMGYDLLPRYTHGRIFTLWHNTPLHHDMHHQDWRGNFGLYFNVWDRLMGTNLPDYDERVLRLP